MKVCFINNFDEKCGVSIYGENILKYKPDGVEYFKLNLRANLNEAIEIASQCDLIHINYYAGLPKGFDIPSLITSVNKPVLINNQIVDNSESWFDLVDIITVHREPSIKYHNGLVVVPHGISEKSFPFKPAASLVLAHAGFPFAWKNHDKICLAANKLKEMGESPKVLFFVPFAREDPTPIINKCLQIIDPDIPIQFITDWLDEDELIPRLHNEASVLIWFTDHSYYGVSSQGVSGSVRMAIAAKRPVVINGNASQYSDLLDEEGIYPVYDEDELASTILRAYKEGKFAKNLIDKNSYQKIDLIFLELYQRMMRRNK